VSLKLPPLASAAYLSQPGFR